MSTKDKDFRRSEKRKKLLGMSYGTAKARLERLMLFSMAQKLGIDICYRCNELIKDVSELSIEHKDSWMFSDNPLESFMSLDNVSFSHSSCNSNAANKKRLPHGKSKDRACKCEPCIKSRNEYNAKWMADWRAKGNDKSRKNYGPVVQ